MNKTYVIAPVAALLFFGATYAHFHSGHQSRETARLEQIRVDDEARLQAESAARRQAIEEALVVQTQRKKEREAKEARDKADKLAREAALDERNRLAREQDKVAREIQSVEKDLAAEKDAVAKLGEARASALAEQAFLRDFVKKAEANAHNLEAVLTQFAQAEAARGSIAQASVK